MAKIVAVHSFRGGTGKSNITANLATAIAATGQRVAIIDISIYSPGIHVLFNVEPDELPYRLNDYLWGNCAIAETICEVSPDIVQQANGRLYLLPSSCGAKDISRMLQKEYDVRLLKSGFTDLIEALNLDYILIDTHPGLNEETLLCMATSDSLVVILRPDQQDYQGTTVMVSLAHKLKVPKILLVANRILQTVDFAALRQQIEATYEVPVIGLFPNCDEIMALASSDLFCLRYPDHPFSQEMRSVAEQVMA